MQLRGHEVGRTIKDIVLLPFDGTFAEALRESYNCAANPDIANFWNWQDSPVPFQTTEYQQELTTIRSVSLCDCSLTTRYTDSQGSGAIRSALQNGNMFREMSASDLTGRSNSLPNHFAMHTKLWNSF
jgi:hypothetical protein